MEAANGCERRTDSDVRVSPNRRRLRSFRGGCAQSFAAAEGGLVALRLADWPSLLHIDHAGSSDMRTNVGNGGRVTESGSARRNALVRAVPARNQRMQRDPDKYVLCSGHRRVADARR